MLLCFYFFFFFLFLEPWLDYVNRIKCMRENGDKWTILQTAHPPLPIQTRYPIHFEDIFMWKLASTFEWFIILVFLHFFSLCFWCKRIYSLVENSIQGAAKQTNDIAHNRLSIYKYLDKIISIYWMYILLRGTDKRMSHPWLAVTADEMGGMSINDIQQRRKKLFFRSTLCKHVQMNVRMMTMSASNICTATYYIKFLVNFLLVFIFCCWYVHVWSTLISFIYTNVYLYFCTIWTTVDFMYTNDVQNMQTMQQRQQQQQ